MFITSYFMWFGLAARRFLSQWPGARETVRSHTSASKGTQSPGEAVPFALPLCVAARLGGYALAKIKTAKPLSRVTDPCQRELLVTGMLAKKEEILGELT